MSDKHPTSSGDDASPATPTRGNVEGTRPKQKATDDDVAITDEMVVKRAKILDKEDKDWVPYELEECKERFEKFFFEYNEFKEKVMSATGSDEIFAVFHQKEIFTLKFIECMEEHELQYRKSALVALAKWKKRESQLERRVQELETAQAELEKRKSELELLVLEWKGGKQSLIPEREMAET